MIIFCCFSSCRRSSADNLWRTFAKGVRPTQDRTIKLKKKVLVCLDSHDQNTFSPDIFSILPFALLQFHSVPIGTGCYYPARAYGHRWRSSSVKCCIASSVKCYYPARASIRCATPDGLTLNRTRKRKITKTEGGGGGSQVVNPTVSWNE